ncbi:gas vesicle protein GvpO [Streptomyces sp. 7N604]|uniref:gas vesicle protein GvpO n=1 Tax=Streptomyces sp. 7N604 TaxID=3457415 RepID=UPI003FD4F3BE
MAERSDNSDNSAADSSPPALDVLRNAGAQFRELSGLGAEAVTRFERREDGWLLEVEILELARIPDTMSLMASYEVTTDREGTITGYRRVRRYERGRADQR